MSARPLHTFNMGCSFAPGALDVALTDALLDVIQALTSNDAPWGVKCRRELDVTTRADEEAPQAALGGVAEGKFFVALLTRTGTSGIQESIRLAHLSSSPDLEFELELDVAEPFREFGFRTIGELFRDCSFLYVPEFYDIAGSQVLLLEMALQRNFTMYGFEQESGSVRLGKSIASLFPRLRFSASRTDGFPIRIGWLNYWPPHVAAKLGFPNAALDAEWLSGSKQLPSGAWIVKLTPEPLDLTRPDHAETLARAYWRFSDIGERMHPVAAKKPRPAKWIDPLVSAEELKTFMVRERDENGQWWQAEYEPIPARNEKEALKILFAKYARSRQPRPRDTLAGLQKAYDEIASEVGLTMSADIDVVEVQQVAPPLQADH